MNYGFTRRPTFTAYPAVLTHNPYFPRHSRLHKGGSAPAQQIASAPVPTPAPPVTSTNAEVIQSEHDLATSNLIKKSVKKTILAGDTGGYNPGAPGSVPGQAASPTAGYKAKLG
jgi:hypothetical protein